MWAFDVTFKGLIDANSDIGFEKRQHLFSEKGEEVQSHCFSGI